MSLTFSYPTELPVSEAKDRIMQAIRSSAVVIVSGQTGSGKTTQIPKMLLELGRGSHGRQIMLTQPRRLAARTVAERIAQEMGTSLGEEIGYRVRFTDRSSPSTRLCVATDGILLAHIQRDPLLTAYDTIMIDEAHERSLNIDFLLGYLSQLLNKRKDLKLIITSATIDSQKFQDHFSQILGHPVPLVEVSGRTYPVEVVYEPLGSAPALMSSVPGFPSHQDDASEDMPSAVARACIELITLSTRERSARDILVFAAGERDIHEYEDAIRQALGPSRNDPRKPDSVEIVSLYARLSAKEQHRVFEAHSRQRIIIATNVAETSLTVPGIRYVVDPGLARISRYSKTAKVQRLPIEPISQASADQRAGRCGRIADGLAIRLYSQEDYQNRPRFTDPEIQRTSLEAVVLQMLSVGVARTAQDITTFGFIDPPDTRSVTDGFNELTELGAIRRTKGSITLTPIGRRLARIPIDVRLGRMIIQASHMSPHTLAALLVIVAFMSLQDPRERPEGKEERADQAHKRYADESSDFLTALNIWTAFFPAEAPLSNSALRKKCKAEFMNYLRMKQWHDLYNQLVQVCKEARWKVGEPKPQSGPHEDTAGLSLELQGAHSLCCSWDSDSIHQAMLSGLLSSIGMQIIREPKASDFAGLKGGQRARALKRAQRQSKNNYQGSRGIRFSLFPASSVYKTVPAWVMAGELVETSRLWARSAAQIKPEWAEELGKGLTRTTYAEPHWSATRGAAVAKSTVLLYGLPIVQGRIVTWSSVNPAQAREFLIRQGLVEGDIHQRFPFDSFLERNRQILQEADEQAHRSRQIGSAATEDDLAEFYDQVLPDHVTSLAALNSWWKKEHQVHPHALDFDPSLVSKNIQSPRFDPEAYPTYWQTVGTDGSDISLRLTYIFDTRSNKDGVTVHIPLSALSRLRPEEFSWNVPGLLDDLIIATIKSLPKAIRVQLIPAPDTARKIHNWIDSRQQEEDRQQGQRKVLGGKSLFQDDFNHVFTQAAIAIRGAQIHPEVFNQEQINRLPSYLRMTFSVEEDQGKNRGKPPENQEAVYSSSSFDRGKVLGESKNLSDLQHRFARDAQASARRHVEGKARKAGAQGKAVTRANLLTQSGASPISRTQLLWQTAAEKLSLPSERISSRWLSREALALASAPYSSTADLVADLQMAAVKRLLPSMEEISSDQELEEKISEVEDVFEDTVYAVAKDVITDLTAYSAVKKEVSGPASLPLLSVLQSITEHLSSLVYPGFIAATPATFLPRIALYCQADSLRLAKARTNKSRDVRWAWQAQEADELVKKAQDNARKAPAGAQHDQACKKAQEVRWAYEEFLISLWAQELGTLKSVSIQRLRKMVSPET